MKSLVMCFLTMLLLYSCGPEILDNRRMLIEGTLVNAQGVPIPNEEISVKDYFEDDNPGFIGRTSGLLGKTSTNEDGSFSFISLVTDGNVALIVNRPSDPERVYVIPNSRWNENEAIIIPQLILKEVAIVQIDFVNGSGTTDPFNIEISYEREFCIEELVGNGFQVSAECPSINEFINNGFNDTVTLETLYPSTISIDYTLNGQSFSEQFMITSPNESYVINY